MIATATATHHLQRRLHDSQVRYPNPMRATHVVYVRLTATPMRQLSTPSRRVERTAEVRVWRTSCAHSQPFALGRDAYAGAARAALAHHPRHVLHPRHRLRPRHSATSLRRMPCQTPRRRAARRPLPGASFRTPPPPRVLASVVIARRLSTPCARRISPRSSSLSQQSTSSISSTPPFTANRSGRSGLLGASHQRATRCGATVCERQLGAKPLLAACIAARLALCAARSVPATSDLRIQHVRRAPCS